MRAQLLMNGFKAALPLYSRPRKLIYWYLLTACNLVSCVIFLCEEWFKFYVLAGHLKPATEE